MPQLPGILYIQVRSGRLSDRGGAGIVRPSRPRLGFCSVSIAVMCEPVPHLEHLGICAVNKPSCSLVGGQKIKIGKHLQVPSRRQSVQSRGEQLRRLSQSSRHKPANRWVRAQHFQAPLALQ